MKAFICWRNDKTQQTLIFFPPPLRAALIRIKPHTVNIFVTAEREIAEWAISDLTLACYETGNRTLDQIISSRHCFSLLTYRDLEVTYRLITLATLKSSVRKRVEKSLDVALDYLSYAVVVPVTRENLPMAFGERGNIETYQSCMGSGRVYLPLRSIFSLVDSVERGTFAVPMPGRKFVLNLGRQVALYRAAFRLIRGL